MDDSFKSDSETGSRDSWDGWEETSDIQNALCLFCESIFESGSLVFEHCKEVHGFSIAEAKSRFVLDCFSFIRMINYLRLQKPLPEDLQPRGNITPECWQADDYMKPAIEDDSLLMFDIESCEEDILELDEESVILTRTQYNELVQRMKHAEAKAASAEDNLQTALSNITQMRTATQNLLMNNLNEEHNTQCRADDDINYFGAYAHFGIHHDMLQDKVRTESYRIAIESNKKLFENKIVLDVGCGTGILAMFAARAGAELVIGIDRSEIIYQAMDIVRENKLEDKVQLIRSRVEDASLPVDHVDIIISEWMGYFLLFECMLDTVIYARDRYLRNGGMILPNKCTISIVGINDNERHDKMITFWQDVYGFKMSCMKKEVIKEASVELVNENTIVTSVAVVKTLDLQTCTPKDVEFSSDFSLIVNRNSDIMALVGYFDAFFDLENRVKFSTSPFSRPTHWKQCIFYLEKPFSKKKGDVISGNISCSRNPKDPRTLAIKIVLESNVYNFMIQ